MNNQSPEMLVKLFTETKTVQSVSRETIYSFMESSNLEVLGALFTFLQKKEYYQKIVPPLNFNDYHKFSLKYFKRCLLENKNGEWVESRYEAGWTFTNWFSGLFKDPTVPRTAIVELKQLVEELYVTGDEKLRTALITAILEHLFQEAEIREFFSDWKTNPLLQPAYAESIEIAKTMPKLIRRQPTA